MSDDRFSLYIIILFLAGLFATVTLIGWERDAVGIRSEQEMFK